MLRESDYARGHPMIRGGVTRRVALAWATAVSAFFVAPRRALAETIRRRLPWAAGASDRPDRIDERPGYFFFSPAEAAFIEAAVERLIPSDEAGPGAREAGVPRFIDRQLSGAYGAGDRFYLQPPFVTGLPTQGWQMQAPAQVYRAAIPAIDQWSTAMHGAAFAALDAPRQDAVLKALDEGDAQLSGGPDAKAFFGLLLQNTIEGYFADPIYGGNRDMAAWRMIGFPGARYNLRPFVLRYGEAYPLPPVGLMGRPDWRRAG
jgi:gluconate 2-dehydrogenase gamma chain